MKLKFQNNHSKNYKSICHDNHIICFNDPKHKLRDALKAHLESRKYRIILYYDFHFVFKVGWKNHLFLLTTLFPIFFIDFIQNNQSTTKTFYGNLKLKKTDNSTYPYSIHKNGFLMRSNSLDDRFISKRSYPFTLY